jgi:hypothetical protein
VVYQTRRKTPQVIEMSSDSRTDRRSLTTFTLATALAASWLTGCGAKTATADQSFPRAEARSPCATDQPADRLAVLDTVNRAYSGTGGLTDPQQKELLEAACQAKDIWDLSQASSNDDATKWVARKSKVPAENARALLNQLAELELHPWHICSGPLPVNAVCPVR